MMKRFPPVVIDLENERTDERDRARMDAARKDPPYPEVGPGRVRPYLFVGADRERAASSTTTDVFPGARPPHIALLLPAGGPAAGGTAEPAGLAPHPVQGRSLPGVQPAQLLAMHASGEER
jgi:hypothetical protein